MVDRDSVVIVPFTEVSLRYWLATLLAPPEPPADCPARLLVALNNHPVQYITRNNDLSVVVVRDAACLTLEDQFVSVETIQYMAPLGLVVRGCGSTDS